MTRRYQGCCRQGRFPLLLLLPVLLSGVAVAFMFYWNGRQAEQLSDWWRERIARSLWEALPRLSGLSPRELIANPKRLEEVLPQSGILAMGFTNAQGWVLEPVGPEKARLLSCGPFPSYGATALDGEDLLVARFPLRGSGPPRGSASSRLQSSTTHGSESACVTESSEAGSEGGHGWGPGRGFGRGAGGGGRGFGRGAGAHLGEPGDDPSEAEGPQMPGGGPFEVVFLLPGQGTPPVIPLLLQRWLWPLAWVAGSALWLWLFKHRERLSALERERQREAHLAVVGQATARLAHEIKNPLGAIRGAAQHVLGKPLSPAQEEMVRMIEQETGRLEELTRGILDFARPPSIRSAECDLLSLLGNVRALMLARSPTPEIIIDGVSEGIVVKGDPAALTQILLNLLDNARSATSGESPITIAFERSSGMAAITVLDRGEGLTAEAREHLFEPFFSTKVRGYGLGLAVSRRLAEAHGGELELAAREGGGCRAELRIPDEVKQ